MDSNVPMHAHYKMFTKLERIIVNAVCIFREIETLSLGVIMVYSDWFQSQSSHKMFIKMLICEKYLITQNRRFYWTKCKIQFRLDSSVCVWCVRTISISGIWYIHSLKIETRINGNVDLTDLQSDESDMQESLTKG